MAVIKYEERTLKFDVHFAIYGLSVNSLIRVEKLHVFIFNQESVAMNIVSLVVSLSCHIQHELLLLRATNSCSNHSDGSYYDRTCSLAVARP